MPMGGAETQRAFAPFSGARNEEMVSMKKILLLAVALMLCAMPALAVTAATPIHRCGDYTYVLQADDTAQIVCWDGPEAEVEVPGTLEGREVTSISEGAFADCGNLKRVTLPETVRDIGEAAFADCVSLCEIVMPEGLKRIGSRAFDRCQVLTRVALPDSIVELGDNPFRGCANLCEIQVSEDHPYLETREGVLFTRPDRRLVSFPMGNMTECYHVPEGTEAIGAMAFERDLYIEEIVLPESLLAIGQEAFNGCEALRTMNLPASVQSIGEAAMRCSNLVLTLEDDSSFGPQFV